MSICLLVSLVLVPAKLLQSVVMGLTIGFTLPSKYLSSTAMAFWASTAKVSSVS